MWSGRRRSFLQDFPFLKIFGAVKYHRIFKSTSYNLKFLEVILKTRIIRQRIKMISALSQKYYIFQPNCFPALILALPSYGNS